MGLLLSTEDPTRHLSDRPTARKNERLDVFQNESIAQSSAFGHPISLKPPQRVAVINVH